MILGEAARLDRVDLVPGQAPQQELLADGLVGTPVALGQQRAGFRIRTGEALTPPAYEPVDVLSVRVVDGLVQVRDERWD